jgi:hypothetical protein
MFPVGGAELALEDLPRVFAWEVTVEFDDLGHFVACELV